LDCSAHRYGRKRRKDAINRTARAQQTGETRGAAELSERATADDSSISLQSKQATEYEKLKHEAMKASNRANTARAFTSAARASSLRRLPEADEMRVIRALTRSSHYVLKVTRELERATVNALLRRGWGEWVPLLGGFYVRSCPTPFAPELTFSAAEMQLFPRCSRSPQANVIFENIRAFVGRDDTSPYLASAPDHAERAIGGAASRLISDTALEAIEVIEAIFRLERTAACKVGRLLLRR
jgi:hypothetical protein